MATVIVVGTDNERPSYDEYGKWRIWNRDEVYFSGGPGFQKHVPKVKDYVRDVENYITWIVDYLDPVTLHPTLRRIRPEGIEQSFSETDVLFGTGRHPMETYRVYIDKSVYPYEMAVDNAAQVFGTFSRYVKVLHFGADQTEKVISRIYDNNGNFVSENVPLEVAAVTNVDVNHSVRVPVPFKTVEDLKSGDFVFVNTYGESGVLLGRRQLVVEETTFLRALNASTKYITGITLDSPFLSLTDDRVIEFPLNLTLNSMLFYGVVNYSDGSTLRLPVDGNKFQMFGREQFVSTIPGQKIELVLKYNLSPGESGLTNVSSDGRSITEYYDLIVQNPNNSYAVKLFGYPVWNSVATGYRLEWFLYNLDRNVVHVVTDKVRFENSHGPFNPMLYGVIQQKYVSINLRDISVAYKNFIHAQRVNITLMGPPMDNNPAWFMQNEVGGSAVQYGEFANATMLSATSFTFNGSFTDPEEWLEEIYYKSYPLINRAGQETRPPKPTHIRVMVGTDSLIVPLSAWNSPVTVTGPIAANRSVKLQFIKRTATQDLELGVAYLTLR